MRLSNKKVRSKTEHNDGVTLYTLQGIAGILGISGRDLVITTHIVAGNYVAATKHSVETQPQKARYIYVLAIC